MPYFRTSDAEIYMDDTIDRSLGCGIGAWFEKLYCLLAEKIQLTK
jgi:hypothetical protein